MNAIPQVKVTIPDPSPVAGLAPLPEQTWLIEHDGQVVKGYSGEQMQAFALAERERIYRIVLRAPYQQEHDDDEDGWGQTEMALKAMAFEILSYVNGHENPGTQKELDLS